MPKILISDALSNLANEVFERNNIEVDTQTDLTPSELKDIINQYDGLVVRSATKATDEIISAGSKLKIIGRAGAGVDNIDLDSAKKNNVIVMNTPGGNTNATAEHTLSLLLSLYRSIPDASCGTHQGLGKSFCRDGNDSEQTVTLIPRARAISANLAPTFPKPIMPKVLPFSSKPLNFFFSHKP